MLPLNKSYHKNTIFQLDGDYFLRIFTQKSITAQSGLPNSFTSQLDLSYRVSLLRQGIPYISTSDVPRMYSIGFPHTFLLTTVKLTE